MLFKGALPISFAIKNGGTRLKAWGNFRFHEFTNLYILTITMHNAKGLLIKAQLRTVDQSN